MKNQSQKPISFRLNEADQTAADRHVEKILGHYRITDKALNDT